MGNKLCAPLWKKPDRESSPWSRKRETHLLRLWTDIFHVVREGDQVSWQRLTDDAVPTNVSCIHDGHEVMYQITAYNRLVEKIFDVAIIQPGTKVTQASECFVHWQDLSHNKEWGLSFASAEDAKKFKDTVSSALTRKLSVGSLKLSPTKKLRSKLGASTPDSLDCGVKPRRVLSSPEQINFLAQDDTNNQYQGYDRSPVKKHGIVESIATVPRGRQPRLDSRTVFSQSSNDNPSNTSSMYDNLTLQKRNESLRHSSVERYEPKNTLSPDNLKAILFGSQENCVEDGPKKKDSLQVQHSSSSGSPDWPAPPEPLTPQSPDTPLCSASFDSDILKKMLQTLPTPSETDDETPTASDNSLLQRTRSLNVHDRSLNNTSPNNRQTRTNQVPGPSTNESRSPRDSKMRHTFRETSQAYNPRQKIIKNDFVSSDVKPAKTDKLLLEYELHLRNECARDSYPDSGFGGTMSEAAESVRSSGSRRSAKSATLPANMPYTSLAKSSTAGSSTGSSSKHSSDLMKQQWSDTTEVRQFMTASEFSDEEERESDSGSSSIHTVPAESQISMVRQGATRKAGWLIVKNWLIHKKRKIELAPKRNWRKYWVCLKGTTLLFYNSSEQQNQIPEDAIPRHMLVIEGGIAQAVPEHPKRENIFALSTAFGDAYLFQASSQIDHDNWISGIHSACASLFARQHGRDNTLKLLKSEIFRLDSNIDTDIKMKKMADLQLTVVTDARSKTAIIKQIAQWEENLEKLYMEQYRMRCYMASLQGSELPNPKTLLSNVSRNTKNILGRLGVFTVSSFHALVCARSPMTMINAYEKKKSKVLRKSVENRARSQHKALSATFSQSKSNSYRSSEDGSVVEYNDDKLSMTQPVLPTETMNFGDNLTRIMLPNSQTIILPIQDGMTVQDLLETACNKRQLNHNDHFVRFKLEGPDNFVTPERCSYMDSVTFERVEICQKIIFQVELRKTPACLNFGLQVEAELAEDPDKEDQLCVFVGELRESGLAQQKGLMVGDEILVVNGRVVSDLDMVYVESLLTEASTLCLTIRSCRVERPFSTAMMEHADFFIDNMMCPPPPSQTRISEKIIGDLIVPAPNWIAEDNSGTRRLSQQNVNVPVEKINQLLRNAEQVNIFCRQSVERDITEGYNDDEMSFQQPLSESQKLRKVILELINTERAYVKDLNCLIERYLEPLKEETFLSNDEIEQLFGNIQEIVQFQKVFLKNLEEAVDLEPDFLTMQDPRQFRRILFSIGGSFLYYANHFKLYSSFCASHSKAQIVLNPDVNSPLKEFLRARNPKQQHSATLESYLIKPIQRILKYPLLLNQLKMLTPHDSDEHHHLSEALKGMEAVAEHINEMQKIYEEYGEVFDELMRFYREENPHNKPVDLNVGDLVMYKDVEWVNSPDEIGKIKKGTELASTVFVFRSGVVLLCKERFSKKKKYKGGSVRGSMIDCPDTVRYQVMVPVSEVQVRSTATRDMTQNTLWELVYLRSEQQGRPEKLYQMASSTFDDKNEFIKNIRQIIRDSVRGMIIPKQINRSQLYNHQRTNSQHNSTNVPAQASQARHSMEFDDNLNVTTMSETDFRGRSKTYSDLINADPRELGTMSAQSQLSIASIGSAKLVQASNNPFKYSENSLNMNSSIEGLGSPIWKRKDLGSPRPPSLYDDPDDIYRTPGNHSEYYYANDTLTNDALMLTPPNAYSEHDTEC